MKALPSLERVYVPSEEVVAREVSGEFILVLIASGVGDLEDEIFSLNETGQTIWSKLASGKKLGEIAEELAGEFDGPLEEIRRDCLGLVQELLERKIVVER